MVAEPKPKPRPRTQSRCPRCGGKLGMNFEPECVICGWADYTYTPPEKANPSILSSGTTLILRYIGDAPSLIEMLCRVKGVRTTPRDTMRGFGYQQAGRFIHEPSCPFCEQPMELSSLSGKRRETREERYKCPQGHRVSLTYDAQNNLGWK